jgi:1,4-dihydroxy-2-naphthoate octaprenyltransferase
MTLAVRLGDDGTRSLYTYLIATAFAAAAALAVEETPWALLSLAAILPLVKANAIVVRDRGKGPALIPVLQLTGVAELVYAAGLFAGLLIAR